MAFPVTEWPPNEDLSENRTGAWEVARNKEFAVQLKKKLARWYIHGTVISCREGGDLWLPGVLWSDIDL